MNESICNECGRQFMVDEHSLSVIKKDDLEVQYLSCPFCGEKYLCFTSDTKMRELVGRRKAIQTKLRAAQMNKFRRKTIEGYLRELDQIKKEQEALLPGLKALGRAILHGSQPSDPKENLTEGESNV